MSSQFCGLISQQILSDFDEFDQVHWLQYWNQILQAIRSSGTGVQQYTFKTDNE